MWDIFKCIIIMNMDQFIQLKKQVLQIRCGFISVLNGVRKKEVLLLYCWVGEIYCKKVDVSLKNMFLRIYFMGGGGGG